MPQAQYDCVVRGGRVGTAVDEFDADIGISGGTIAAIGRNLPAGASEIDARGKLVSTPTPSRAPRRRRPPAAPPRSSALPPSIAA